VKKIFAITTLFISAFTICTLNAQVLNQLEVVPSNPTESDTIYIISDFSYNGNCTFGLVDTYVSLMGSTILVMPLYCGYWDTTLCHSIDTFKVGPYPAGTYTLNMEYHQGSICPYSGFDATIYQLDIAVFINITTHAATSLTNSYFSVSVFPNPSRDFISIQFPNPEKEMLTITVYNALGQVVEKMGNISGTEVKIENKKRQKGIYYFKLQSNIETIGQGKFIIQ